MNNKHRNITDLSMEELIRALAATGEPAWRARQVHQWLFSHHAGSFEAMTNLGAPLRRKLSETFTIVRPVIDKHDESLDEGGPAPTEKLLLKLADAERVESVLIPAEGRLTACVSSQVGCSLGCTFCATGKMGLQRNLSPGEIIGQVDALNDMLSTRGSEQRITNVVFMGMGEPLTNTEAVLEAVRTLSSEGYRDSISQRRITISTVGIINEIDRIAHLGLRTKLAVSLHSAIQEKREALMPAIARNHPLKLLRRSLAAWNSATGQPVTIAYMLLQGVNDSAEDAIRLARFAKGFLCKINLIDYNPILTINFKPVFPETRDMFKTILLESGVHVTVRKSYGTTINAACGQLATKGRREPKHA